MGTFSLSSKRDIDADALTATVQIADADIDRITIAYAQLYFPNGVPVPEVPEIPGTPEIPEVPARDAVPAVPPTFDADGNMTDPGSPEIPAVAYQPGVPAVPGVPGIPASVRPPTGQEVFDALAKGLLDGILANTINVEKANAAKQAQENVPPIVVDPSAA